MKSSASAPSIKGSEIEAKFWQQGRAGSRSVTTSDVIKVYREEDFSSLRAGFFMQELFLKKVPHEQSQVTPEQVIAEFRRSPDGEQKYLLAIARFQATCLLDNIPLNGKPISADAVADLFPKNDISRLGLARFREGCCLKKIPLRGQPVTPESVVESFEAIDARLELAHFKATCCLDKITLYGRSVTTKAVVESFPDTESGRYALARFKKNCNRKGRHLDGKVVSSDVVLNDLARAGAKVDLVLFKARCCLDEQLVNGKLIPPETVLQDFHTLIEGMRKAACTPGAQTYTGNHFPGNCSTRHTVWQHKDSARLDSPGATKTDNSPAPYDPKTAKTLLELAQFKAACCRQELPIHGKLLSPESVVEDFEALGARLELARFRQSCCLARVKINGRLPSTDSVAGEMRAIGANQELAYFTEACFNEGLRLNGKPISPEMVVAAFKTAKIPLPLTRFKQDCCVKRVRIAGRLVTADEVAKAFSNISARLELARFMEICCLEGLPIAGSFVEPGTVVNHYQAINATRELAHFRVLCLQNGLKPNGQPVTPESALAGLYQNKGANLSIARFEAMCCLAGQLVNGKAIQPEAVINRYPATLSGQMGLARFKEECCLRGVQVAGQLISPKAVIESFPRHQEGMIALARFKECCCLQGLRMNGKLISPDQVVADYPPTAKGRMGLASFMTFCHTRNMPLAGQRVTAREVIDSFPDNSEGRQGVSIFLGKCCLKGLWVDGRPVTTEEVVSAMEQSCSALFLARFKAKCCLSNLTIDGQQVTADAVKEAFPRSPLGRKHLAKFLEKCCLNGLTIDGQLVLPEQVTAEYAQNNQKLERALFYARLALQSRKLNGNCLSNDDVLNAFDQLSGNHAKGKVDFLLQRLMALPPQSEEAPATLRQAWQIIETAPMDDQRRCQCCVLEFLSIRLSDQPVSHDQVWQSIKGLRQSIPNLRIRFFFLAHCYSQRIKLDGSPVTVSLVAQSLKKLPVCSYRQRLEHWFGELREERLAVDFLGEVVSCGSDFPAHSFNLAPTPSPLRKRPKWIEVNVDDLFRDDPPPGKVLEYFDDPPQIDPALVNLPTRRTLSIIQSIGQLRITGSFARCLQGVGSSFNDIDLLGSQEAINQLISQLNSQFQNQEQSDDDLTCRMFAQLLPGCPELRLPTAYSITLNEGDLGERAVTIQASVYPPEMMATLERWELELPWKDERAVCVPFDTEARLLNDNLEFLTRQLPSLTGQLLSGSFFNISRTIVFNFPQTPDECVFALLMRCLLSINKAMQFIDLLGETNNQTMQRQLKASCDKLLAGVRVHHHCQPLAAALKKWLSWQPDNIYLRQRCDFIRHILALIDRAAELP